MGGKMVSKRLSIYGLISAAAVISGALVGCGGSSASVQGAQGTVNTTGGLTSTTQTFTSGVGSSTSPQQVQVTVNGSTQNATLPAGESIAAGQSVAVVPPTPIIAGLTLGPKTKGEKAAPTSGAQGSVYVDGTNTGLTVTSSGALSGYLILTPGTHNITAYGPFVIVGGSAFAPTQLTVGKFVFQVIVASSGTASIPTALTLNLPVNGGFISHGSFVTAGYDPSFVGYGGTLIIAYSGATIVKAQTLTFNSATNTALATYNALSSHPAIPSNGVDSVTFNINP